MVDSVVLSLLRTMKADGRCCYIKCDNVFYVGLLLAVDDGFVQIADERHGATVISLSTITEAREWKVGGRG